MIGDMLHSSDLLAQSRQRVHFLRACPCRAAACSRSDFKHLSEAAFFSQTLKASFLHLNSAQLCLNPDARCFGVFSGGFAYA